MFVRVGFFNSSSLRLFFTESFLGLVAKISTKVMHSSKVMSVTYQMESSVIALFINAVYSVNLLSTKFMHHRIIAARHSVTVSVLPSKLCLGLIEI